MTTSTTWRLGPIDQIPRGEGRAFEVEGRQIAVFHTRSGAVYAVEAVCPHRGGPLADGLLGGTLVVCPLHGWKFDLASGATPNGGCAIQPYAASLNALGEISIMLPDGECGS
jgi:nitrite reductase (NADH) small subunit